MTQDELAELAKRCGQIYGLGLSREHPILDGSHFLEQWLELGEVIGDTRAQDLSDGDEEPTQAELDLMIRFRVSEALAEEEIYTSSLIWICKPDESDQVIVIEGTGGFDTELLVLTNLGQYPSEDIAIEMIKENFVFDVDDI